MALTKVSGDVIDTQTTVSVGSINVGTGASISSPATNVLTLGTNGARRIQITSSGDVAFGNFSDPLGRIDLRDGKGVGTAWISRVASSEAVANRGFRQLIDGSEYLALYHTNTAAVFEVNSTERMRITSNGYLKASNDGVYMGSTGSFHELRSTVNEVNTAIRTVNASFTSTVLQLGATRAASTVYSFLQAFSAIEGSSDREYNLRGDGTGFCDGTWTSGGADYAEYFEWSDSNLDEEDRRGISVVLDGNKIREALPGEDPIGVISGNPSVVGDAAWNRWSGKYLRDEYGTYIQEDYEVEDEDDNTVIQQRRKLNPAYDPDLEYVSRENRPEWDCVGLMGKLRIRKGQSTGSRWIKMRDINDSVEEWLVR